MTRTELRLVLEQANEETSERRGNPRGVVRRALAAVDDASLSDADVERLVTRAIELLHRRG